MHLSLIHAYKGNPLSTHVLCRLNPGQRGGRKWQFVQELYMAKALTDVVLPWNEPEAIRQLNASQHTNERDWRRGKVRFFPIAEWRAMVNASEPLRREAQHDLSALETEQPVEVI